MRLLKIILLLLSLILIPIGYLALIPVLLSIGLIILDKSLLAYSRFLSQHVTEFTTISVILVGLFYGTVAGVLFALFVPIFTHILAYIIVRKERDDLIPQTFQLFETISYIIITVIAPFITFLPFVIIVVLLLGIKFSLSAGKSLMEDKIPNLLSIGITLVIGFYIAQFLESYAVNFLVIV